MCSPLMDFLPLGFLGTFNDLYVDVRVYVLVLLTMNPSHLNGHHNDKTTKFLVSIDK